MLRIHFLPEDLSRTFVATVPDPLWETVLSLQLLHQRRGELVFKGWRSQVRAHAPRSAEATLLALSPPYGDFADLLTPAAGTLGLAAGLEAVRATPLRLIRRDLAHLAAGRRLPAWARRLADGDRDALAHLADAIRSWHDVAVAPYQARIVDCLDADRAIRMRDARLGGPERLLAGLPPPFRWQPPVLTTPYPEERDLHLNGRGLLLVPSFFCWRMPVSLIDPGLPPVLVYPVEHDLEWWCPPPGGPAVPQDRALATLLGATRAAVLDIIGAGPITTTGIAKRARISPPSASEHATVLREAGLITTRRSGPSVLHNVTRLGAALLNDAR